MSPKAVGSAKTFVHQSKAGTLPVNVAGNAVSAACSASKRILAAPNRRVGAAGAATGGAALTHRNG